MLALRAAGNMLATAPSLSKQLYKVVVHEHDPIFCPKVYFVWFLTGMVGGCPHGYLMGSGWLPIAWGRGC